MEIGLKKELNVGDEIEVLLYKSKTEMPYPVGYAPGGKVILLNKYNPKSRECKVGEVVRLRIIEVKEEYYIGDLIKKVGIQLEFEAKLMKIEGVSLHRTSRISL